MTARRIQSVQRAVDIIKTFLTAEPSITLSEIAETHGLNKTTAHGIVSTLVQNDFLEKDPRTQLYNLGPMIFLLGMAFSNSLEINRQASIPAHELAQKVRQTPRIAIWMRDSALITFFAVPDANAAISHQIGPRLPAYCSSLGKALLAFGGESRINKYLENANFIRYTENTLTSPKAILEDLDITRERGYSINRGEMSLEREAIAFPIWGYEKKLKGALALSGSRSEILGQNMSWLLDNLQNTASQISRLMGYAVGNDSFK